MHECDRIIQSIEHFYGHLHIECSGHLGLTSIEYKENIEPRLIFARTFNSGRIT